MNLLLTANEGLENQVYNYLSGKGEYYVNMFLNGEEIKPGEIHFVYLFDTEKMPEDITAGALHKFLVGQKMINPKKKREVIFSWASKSAGNKTIIVMNKFMDRLKQDEIKKIKEEIHSKGLNVLYISEKFHFGVFLTDERIIRHEKDDTVDKPGNPSLKPTY